MVVVIELTERLSSNLDMDVELHLISNWAGYVRPSNSWGSPHAHKTR